jgi:adenine-specific DNA-methyltransferase
MAKKALKQTSQKTVVTITHEKARRKNIPTAEYQSVLQQEEQSPIRVGYERRNRDLDPQLFWRGKDEQDWSDLVVHAPPLYIQEKVHPKVLIDALIKQTRDQREQEIGAQPDLFADFNGIPKGVDRTEFYRHEQNWSNRMILGDSLQVMASLAEREGLRGKVQYIYIDPPYGIKFNSNFQWSTTSRTVTDGKMEHITREPEQVKAFRDTWRDGIHSYLTYLRDRITAVRDLLADTGSIFVQIGDENVHRVRAVMDEIFGDSNFCALLPFQKTSGGSVSFISADLDYLLWYAKRRDQVKYRPVKAAKDFSSLKSYKYAITDMYSDIRPLSKEEKNDHSLLPEGECVVQISFLGSQDPGTDEDRYYTFRNRPYDIGAHRHWKTSNPTGLDRLAKASRIYALGSQLNYKRLATDSDFVDVGVLWNDVGSAGFSNADPKVYVVQTDTNVVQRCLLMTTDPGDLVLDPTCGSGTTAYVAEQWGRRWITIDTSRVALALARARIMGARYPYYLLADSPEGQLKEAEITRSSPSSQPTHGDIRQGFVYERVPHITLKSIANNAEIDVIWEQWQAKLELLREALNKELQKSWQEWEIPREADARWSAQAKQLHADWWQARIARQKEIDASIAARAEFEFLYDKPYDDKKRVRVAGPFTVESLSPHRVLGVDEDDELIDGIAESQDGYSEEQSFVQMILEHLKTAGVQQAHKEDKITFTSLTPWPGDLVCAEGRYIEGNAESGSEKRAAIFIGPEFGTVSRPDLVSAAREAGDADFDVLIACAFNYDAHSAEFDKLGRIPILKARMNADLHMAGDLKNTGKGNLFVIFGEPDIDIIPAEGGQIRVKVNGVDVFHPQTGEVRSDGPEGIACWFIDTDYNEESFFVRHAYFLGANDPYKSLKITLKAEINEEAWATLNSDISRPFDKPSSGRIAVKVINHLGDEVMKVFQVR